MLQQSAAAPNSTSGAGNLNTERSASCDGLAKSYSSVSVWFICSHGIRFSASQLVQTTVKAFLITQKICITQTRIIQKNYSEKEAFAEYWKDVAKKIFEN